MHILIKDSMYYVTLIITTLKNAFYIMISFMISLLNNVSTREIGLYSFATFINVCYISY